MVAGLEPAHRCSARGAFPTRCVVCHLLYQLSYTIKGDDWMTGFGGTSYPCPCSEHNTHRRPREPSAVVSLDSAVFPAVRLAHPSKGDAL